MVELQKAVQNAQRVNIMEKNTLDSRFTCWEPLVYKLANEHVSKFNIKEQKIIDSSLFLIWNLHSNNTFPNCNFFLYELLNLYKLDFSVSFPMESERKNFSYKIYLKLNQPRNSALKIDWQEVLNLNPSHVHRPYHLEFSIAFSQTCINRIKA